MSGGAKNNALKKEMSHSDIKIRLAIARARTATLRLFPMKLKSYDIFIKDFLPVTAMESLRPHWKKKALAAPAEKEYGLTAPFDLSLPTKSIKVI